MIDAAEKSGKIKAGVVRVCVWGGREGEGLVTLAAHHVSYCHSTADTTTSCQLLLQHCRHCAFITPRLPLRHFAPLLPC